MSKEGGYFPYKDVKVPEMSESDRSAQEVYARQVQLDGEVKMGYVYMCVFLVAVITLALCVVYLRYVNGGPL